MYLLSNSAQILAGNVTFQPDILVPSDPILTSNYTLLYSLFSCWISTLWYSGNVSQMMNDEGEQISECLRLFVEHVVDNVSGQDPLFFVPFRFTTTTTKTTTSSAEPGHSTTKLVVWLVVKCQQCLHVIRRLITRISTSYLYIICRHERQISSSRPTQTTSTCHPSISINRLTQSHWVHARSMKQE